MHIPLHKLEPWNPFKRCVWPGLTVPVTEKEIAASIQSQSFYKEPVPEWNFINQPASRQTHINRIAFLTTLPLPFEPIDIDVGVPSLHCYVDWIIVDGNHRLAAAFFRHDEFISANISGCTSLLKEMFDFNPPTREDTTPHPPPLIIKEYD